MASEISQGIFEEKPEAIYLALRKSLKKGNPKVFAVLAGWAFGKHWRRVLGCIGRRAPEGSRNGFPRTAGQVAHYRLLIWSYRTGFNRLQRDKFCHPQLPGHSMPTTDAQLVRLNIRDADDAPFPVKRTRQSATHQL